MSTAPALLIACPPAKSLVQTIYTQLDGHQVVELCPVEFSDFPNGERFVTIQRSVRGRHVVVVQCACSYAGRSPDDALRHFMLVCDALCRGSAMAVTGILPIFPYQRQERKERPRTPISAAVVATEIESAMRSIPEKRVVALDLHASAIQGFFDIPFDALTASTEFAPVLAKAGYFTVVAPDVGGAKRGELYIQLLEEYAILSNPPIDVEMAVIYKRRKGPTQVEIPWVTGGHAIKGRDVVIVDDVLGTGGTAREAGIKCRQLGARRVALTVTHAECSQEAWNKIAPEVFDDVFITDSLPLERLPQPLPAHWQVVSVAPLLAEAIREIVLYGSVSNLEKRRPSKR